MVAACCAVVYVTAVVVVAVADVAVGYEVRCVVRAVCGVLCAVC